MADFFDTHNEREMADFFDTHDVSEYWNEMEPVESLKVRVIPSRKKRVSLRLSAPVVDLLESVAASEGVSRQALLQRWVEEKLRQHLPSAAEA
jgi:predicted DNA binding CopG/RHH family protein